MNMLNYLRGKVSKIQVDSPSKGKKPLTSAEQIYLQQISNYIEAQGGYDILREKLFKAINEYYMHDSPLVQEMVILLRKGVQSKMRDKQIRSITIIEDLLSNCTNIMNQAFNDKNFCYCLVNSASFLMNLKGFDRQQIRERIGGLFLYWHNKFQADPRYTYHQGYQAIKRLNLPIPALPYVKQLANQNKVQSAQQNPNKSILDGQQQNNVDLIVKDCQQTSKQCEKLINDNVSKIDTNYVRMLKAKTKTLYGLSTSKQIQLTSQQKEKISQCYKKIRNSLKQIQKINQQVARQKAIEKEKMFLQQKIQNLTPKKSQKEIAGQEKDSQQLKSSPFIKKPSTEERVITPKKVQKVESVDLLDIDLVADSLPELNKIETPKKKQSSQQQQIVLSTQLLDIQTINSQVDLMMKKKTSKPQGNNSKVAVVQRQQSMSTPKKSNRKEQDDKLLDLSENYHSPSIDSEKKLNFKQLYAVNQLSPELRDLDLGTPEKLKSKQSIKSDEDAEFGDFS